MQRLLRLKKYQIMKINKLNKNMWWLFMTACSITHVPIYASQGQEYTAEAQDATSEDAKDSLQNELKSSVEAIDVRDAGYSQEFKTFVLQYMRKNSFSSLKQLNKKERNKIAALFQVSHEEIENMDFLFSSHKGYYVNISKGVLISNIMVDLPDTAGLVTSLNDAEKVKRLLEQPLLIKEKGYLSSERLKQILPFLERSLKSVLTEASENLTVEAAIKYHKDDKVNKLYVVVRLGPDLQLQRSRLVITGLNPRLTHELKFNFIGLKDYTQNATRSYSISEKNHIQEQNRVLKFFVDKGYLDVKINTFKYADGLLYMDINPGAKFTRTYQIIEMADSQSKPLTVNEARGLEAKLQNFAKEQAFNADNDLNTPVEESVENLKKEITNQLKEDDRCFFSVDSVQIINVSEKSHKILFYVNPALFKCRVGQVQIVGSHRVDLFQHLLPFRNKNEVYFSQKTLDESVEKIRKLPHIKLCAALPEYKKNRVNITYIIVDVMEYTRFQIGGAFSDKGSSAKINITDRNLVRTGVPVVGAIAITFPTLARKRSFFGNIIRMFQSTEALKATLITTELQLELETSTRVFNKQYSLDITTGVETPIFLERQPILGKVKLSQNLVYDNFLGLELSRKKSKDLAALPAAEKSVGTTCDFFLGNKSGEFKPKSGVMMGVTRSIDFKTDTGLNALFIKGGVSIALPAPIDRDFLISRVQGSFRLALAGGANQTYLRYKDRGEELTFYQVNSSSYQSEKAHSLTPGTHFYGISKEDQQWQKLATVNPAATLSLKYKLAMPLFFKGMTARNFSPQQNLSVVSVIGADLHKLDDLGAQNIPSYLSVVSQSWQIYFMCYLRIPFNIPIIGNGALDIGISQGLARGSDYKGFFQEEQDMDLTVKSPWFLFNISLNNTDI
jgi:hypothetical protein